MGNCQAAEAAEVIVQHPGGKVERLYWPTPAADVMKSNPGHYVALVILRLSPDDKAVTGAEAAAAGAGAAKITRVKLLKPKDTLHLGQVYRLITAQGSSLLLLLVPMPWELAPAPAWIRPPPAAVYGSN
jgi:hypothetical protein